MEQNLKISEDMEANKGHNFSETACKHRVCRSFISRLWKTRKETVTAMKGFQNLSRKRKNQFKEEDVDIALNTWLGQKNDQNARINGPILKVKAQQLAAEMGHDFTPSDGWISRFEERHGIAFKREHGEKQCTDFESGQKWRERALVLTLTAKALRSIWKLGQVLLLDRVLYPRILSVDNLNTTMPKQMPTGVAEALITAVQKRECLYNTRNAGYRNRNHRELAWKDAADEIQMDVTLCKTMWASLRCTFNRNLAAMKNVPSGSGADRTPKWQFFQQMLFLKDHVSHGLMVSNFSHSHEDSGNQDIDTFVIYSDNALVEDSPQSDTPVQPSDSKGSPSTPSSRVKKRSASEDPVQKTVPEYINETKKPQEPPEDEGLAFFRGLLPFYRNLSQNKKLKFMHHMTGYLMELSAADDQ